MVFNDVLYVISWILTFCATWSVFSVPFYLIGRWMGVLDKDEKGAISAAFLMPLMLMALFPIAAYSIIEAYNAKKSD